MAVLEARGGYLYQHRPDLFPHGYLTMEEMSLWAAYTEIRNAEREEMRGKRG
jgi:hypothetical protein